MKNDLGIPGQSVYIPNFTEQENHQQSHKTRLASKGLLHKSGFINELALKLRLYISLLQMVMVMISYWSAAVLSILVFIILFN